MKQAARRSPRRAALVLIMLPLVACLGCAPAVNDWEQDAYVWSANHHPDAEIATLPLSRHRLLVLQWQVDHGAKPRHFDRRRWLHAFPAAPTVAVVRLDGYRIDQTPALVADTLADAISDWPTAPVAVEIDHDAATGRVGDYAAWLAEFEAHWRGRSPIWITALPDWQHSPDLRALLRSIDAVTLQVHAVDRPMSGLLDHDKAMAAIAAFERLADTPLFVALPTYQLRVGWDRDGAVRFVEGEQPIAASAAQERTLFVEPDTLATIARTLEQTRVASRRGIAWYRLPREGDRQSLSLATFSALVNGAPTAQALAVQARAAGDGATHDIVISNPGPLDGSLPPAIAWAAGCLPGDAAFGYRIANHRHRFERDAPGLVRAGESRTIGWIRCPRGQAPAPLIAKPPDRASA